MLKTQKKNTENDYDSSLKDFIIALIVSLIIAIVFYKTGILNIFTFIVILFLFFVFFKGPQWSKEQELEKQQIDSQIENGFKSLKNFDKTKMLNEPVAIVYNSKKGIAFDEHNKKICFWKATKDDFSSKIIPYKSVLSVEIFQDGVSITKTNRLSQLGTTIVGGVVGGLAGAVVGGLTAKTETKVDKPKHVQLRLVINDTNEPLYDIDLMLPKGDSAKALEDARYWSGVFAAIIKQADEEDSIIHQESIQQQSNELKESPSEKNNLSDRLNTLAALKELAELKASGVLTEDEFLQEKQKLLA